MTGLKIAFGALFAATASVAQLPSATPEPPYRVVHGWPIFPDGEMLGQATGADVDSSGRVHVFHRAGRMWSEPFPKETIAKPTLAIFDPNTGDRLKVWGEQRFIMPHGLTIDAADNIWVTDVGLHQVFKFSPNGRLLLTLGEAGVAGSDEAHFNMPTDVAVLPDGSFYVSDGYGNARVLKFSAEGKLERQWGRKGSGPGEFDTPHAISVDTNGRVYVADRENGRVQVFTPDGRHFASWKSPALGRPYSVPICGDRALVLDGGDQPQEGPDRSGAALTDLEGRVLARFGRFGFYDGQFYLAHDGACGRDGALFVVDAWGQRVQKFTPPPER
ncbi:peptidyl-alpha-hydroxyglycine alpha-amidating lyase family protein [soil metagenome]